MAKHFQHLAVVSMSTVASRVLGLSRDILVFAALGASVWNSAFVLAFTLPNLFRRLLGEGALTSALVPVFSQVMEDEGRERAFLFFNRVLTRLALALVVLVLAVGVALTVLGGAGWVPERWRLGAGLGGLLLPYMIFICLAAIVSAGLNLLGRFAAAALTPVVLNLAIIFAAVAGLLSGAAPHRLVYWLCGGVLVGGLLQLLLPAWDLRRQGWRPGFRWDASPWLGRLWELFLPGLLGAAILQVNILISRVLAFALNETAASELYLASRLMELPLGVFTVAVATVFFPRLARSASRNDESGFTSAYLQGLRLVLAIAVPAGLGLALLGKPVLTLLFEWGAFDRTAVLRTVPLIAVYGIGLPFYSVATFATRGLHAGKDMRTPLRAAAVCLAANLVLSLALMGPFGAAGLAAANVGASLLQCLLLHRVLAAGRPGVRTRFLRPALLRIAAAAVLMGLLCAGGNFLTGLAALPDKADALLTVAGLIPACALAYLGLLYLFRFEDRSELVGLVLRKKALTEAPGPAAED